MYLNSTRRQKEDLAESRAEDIKRDIQSHHRGESKTPSRTRVLLRRILGRQNPPAQP